LPLFFAFLSQSRPYFGSGAFFFTFAPVRPPRRETAPLVPTYTCLFRCYFVVFPTFSPFSPSFFAPNQLFLTFLTFLSLSGTAVTLPCFLFLVPAVCAPNSSFRFLLSLRQRCPIVTRIPPPRPSAPFLAFPPPTVGPPTFSPFWTCLMDQLTLCSFSPP